MRETLISRRLGIVIEDGNIRTEVIMPNKARTQTASQPRPDGDTNPHTPSQNSSHRIPQALAAARSLFLILTQRAKSSLPPS